MGVFIRQRLQSRLSRVVHAGGEGSRQGRVQLRNDGVSKRRSAGTECVHQDRHRPGAAHLLILRARPRHSDRHLQFSRFCAEGPRRRRVAMEHGMGAPPRRIRSHAHESGLLRLVLNQQPNTWSVSMIKVSAFRWVPPFARGLVRDLRVRWALEEAGLPYQARLIGPDDQKSKSYRAMQPFGQVPAFESDNLVLFESGAILLQIAEQSGVLMPSDPKARARTTAWMFAALNSVEPHIQNLTAIDLFHADQEWAKQRRPAALELARTRLAGLSDWLDGRDYLEDRFTVADLLMTTVLRIPRQTDLIAKMPTLEAYRLRCEARPAFKKALAAQMADFTDEASAA